MSEMTVTARTWAERMTTMNRDALPMTNRDDLLNAIDAEAEDEPTCLVHADWREEHGEDVADSPGSMPVSEVVRLRS